MEKLSLIRKSCKLKPKERVKSVHRTVNKFQKRLSRLEVSQGGRHYPANVDSSILQVPLPQRSTPSEMTNPPWNQA